jgi:hypothetical protein
MIAASAGTLSAHTAGRLLDRRQYESGRGGLGRRRRIRSGDRQRIAS